jgi:hypothetical protein
MEDDFAYDVFLSYSNKDKAFVRSLANRLRGDGIRIWFDEWEIRPGDSVPAKIEEGLNQSRVLVLCMSANTFDSDWAQLESGTFRFHDPLNKQRRFIPLRFDDTPIPGSLAQFRYIDWRPNNREQEYPKLITACRPSGESPAITNDSIAPELSFGFDAQQYLKELDCLFKDSRIADWYVSLAGYRESATEEREDVNVDEFVDSWLKLKQKGRLAILGDYGTGKSWLCLLLAKRLADSYRNSATGGPLPLLISFKRYQTNMDLAELIRAELFDGYAVEVENLPDLRRGLKSGSILPILDGLDEMAKALGERTALVAYSRLGLASEIPKVLVTCRTHYFYSGSEQREFLTPDAGYRELAKVPKFEILHLKLLDKSRIRECITRRCDQSKAAEVVHFVESTYNLPELCSRPVLLSLVCDSHDQLPNLVEASSSSDLYEIYIDSWLHREFRDGRLAIEPDAVKYFFEDLAEAMVKESTLVVDGTRLKQQLLAFLECLGRPPDKWKEIDRQIITSTFIRRSVGDGWQFAHRSFQEFFYARKFFRWEKATKGKGKFPVVHTPIWQFIAQMALARWDEEKALYWIKERVAREDDATLTMTTLRAAAGYWLLKQRPAKLKNNMLSGIMLDSVDLTRLDLACYDLSRSDFHGSDLTGTNLSSANLSHALLFGAQFSGANLMNAKLYKCDVSNSDFRMANFGSARSAVWKDMINQIRSCHGWASALFDQEVHSYLK